MLDLRALMLSLLALCFGCVGFGCAGFAGPAPTTGLPLRLLSTEAPTPPQPEAAPSETQSDTPIRDIPAPRIGAPGGSGAGSRRVVPVQSGKETVGGLPVGRGGGTGPAGRG